MYSCNDSAGAGSVFSIFNLLLHFILPLLTFFFNCIDRSCRDCLSEVYMPVIQTVLEAPTTSPLSDIEASNVAEFLVQLTRPTQHNVSSLNVL